MNSDGGKEIECEQIEVRKTAPGLPFKPGNDPRRNLAGRPKNATPFADCMRRRAKEIQPDGRPLVEHIVDTVAELAKGGERWAAELLIERIEGKVKDVVDLNHGTQDLQKLTDEELHRIAAGYPVPD